MPNTSPRPRRLATMKNANGIRMTLRSTSQGISMQAGPEGIRVTLTR